MDKKNHSRYNRKILFSITSDPVCDLAKALLTCSQGTFSAFAPLVEEVMMNDIVCAYCATLNESENTECFACGAPLESPGPVMDAQPEPLPFVIQPLENMKQVDDFEQVQQAFLPATHALGAVWQIIGAAIAIGLTAFGLGVFGAIFDLAAWALLGALFVGIAVGLSRKNFWPTILGAPMGLLAGLLVGGILWAIGVDPGWVVFIIIVGAILGAVIGSRRRAAGGNRWDKLRPWLGALAGLFFGVVGLFIGEGFQQFILLVTRR